MKKNITYMESYASLDEWIQQEAIPFSLDSPRALDASIDKLMASLGHVELLGLGEPMHGGEDILMLRNSLFRRLAENHGFSVIAVESSFSRAHSVNEYIMGLGPASYDDIAETGFSHGFGLLDANRELVDWMREYNAVPSNRIKLRFYGFDAPTEMMYADSPRQVLHFVLDYLSSIDGEIGKKYLERIDPLLGKDLDWENPAATMDPSKSVGSSQAACALRLETEDLITDMRLRLPEFVAKSGLDSYLEAEQHAVIARQLLNYHAGLAQEFSGERTIRLLGIRDTIIADNLGYMVERERGRGKVLAFAHNSHLQRSRAQWQLGPDLLTWWPAGGHLDALFGPRYAVIGSGLGVSAGNGIGQPEAGSFEARLTEAKSPVRFFPTHRGQGLHNSEITSLQVRSGSMKNTTYFPLTNQSLTDFDWLAVLDSTGYSRGGPKLQE